MEPSQGFGGLGPSPIDFRRALNDEQYAAVTAPDGPALVLAGAGSGKTRTLTYRVAYLLQEQAVRPWQILLLTFTNKAAREMLTRVEQLTGVGAREFWGGTFHSLGQRVLRRFGGLIDLSPNFTILDDKESESLLVEAIRAVDAGYLKKKDNPKAGPWMNALSYARNALRPPGEVAEERLGWSPEPSKHADAFAAAYEQRKRTAMALDYDDLLALWLKLLREHPPVVDWFHGKFRHVLVDEYQDTNPLQAEIVDRAAYDQRIMAVGDDAQCIYTWRGADVENILGFTDRHPGAQLYRIETNYRSTPQILDLANAVLLSQPAGTALPKTLRPTKRPKQKPLVAQVVDTRAQAAYLVQTIEQLLENGFELNDICVLYRAHFQALDAQLALTKRGVPYSITSGLRFFEQAHVKDIACFLRLLANPADFPAFARLATLLPKIGEKAAERLFALAEETARRRGEPLMAVLGEPAVTARVPEVARESWESFAFTCRQLSHLYAPPAGSAAPSADAAEGELTAVDLFAEDAPPPAPSPTPPRPRARVPRQLDMSPEDPSELPASPAPLLEEALEGWYGDHLRAHYPDASNREEDLRTLMGFARNFTEVGEFLSQLVLLGGETTEKGLDPERGTLRLSTIHQAKGLEFPVVFVLGLADGLFPGRRALDEGDLEEERRLFYVATTRAQDFLFLLYPQLVSQPGGGFTRMPPSTFLKELPNTTYELQRVTQVY